MEIDQKEKHNTLKTSHKDNRIYKEPENSKQ